MARTALFNIYQQRADNTALCNIQKAFGTNTMLCAMKLKATFKGGTFKDFLQECVACGGNWVRMIETGIESLYPELDLAIGCDCFGHNGYNSAVDGMVQFSMLTNLLSYIGYTF